MHLNPRTELPSTLSLVVPVYNEQDAIPIFLHEVYDLFDSSKKPRIELIFINDGSRDNTLAVLSQAMEKDSRIMVVDLSRNFGKEAALSAGLKHATGQVVVPIDVDLQDPPELILDMIKKWQEGYDVVLGKRANRDSDSWAKKASAGWFYRIHNKIANPQIPEQVGDFRLMDRSVVEALNRLPENHRFMKGLFAWVGFPTATVHYERPVRSAGESKFNGWKLWNFALEGLTSFSTAPLRIWTYVGMVISGVSLLYAAYIAVHVLISGIDVPGYASLMVAITFFGGVQLIGIGVLGEYLGRAYTEAKRRPTYIVREVMRSPDEQLSIDVRRKPSRPNREDNHLL